MASLAIYKGGAHTGKSTALYERIRAHKEAGEHAILLVPEQATYAAEQKLCKALGGLLGVEVYSFERFSERLLSRFGVSKPFLSVEGRHMVLRRSAFRRKAELTVFSRVSQTNGFAEVMDELIGRLKQSCIAPQDLETAIAGMDPESLLYQKLHDILAIYRDSEEFLASRYLTAQDLLTEALQVLPKAELSDTYVYVDDLDRTREQVMRLLEGLIEHAGSVTVTLRAEPDPALSDLFRPEEERAAALVQFCAERGIPFFTKEFKTQSAKVDPALNHLCRGLFLPEPPLFGKETDAVCVTSCATQALEAELTADRILEIVKADPSIRYSDIAIVVSSLDAYAPLLRRAFRMRHIPLFFDASRPILGHAATDFVLSSVRAAIRSLRVDDVLHVLKSGYAGVSVYDTEIFENYLIRYGLFGSALAAPFAVGSVPSRAEKVRAAIAPKLLLLKESLAKETAGEKVRGVYAYLKEMGLMQKLKTEADALLAAGESQDAQTYAQMWNTLMAVFSQIDAIMGDVPMGQKEFCALLEEGLSGCRIGVLPGSSDQVVLGDLVRTRLNRCKMLFLLGCTEGAFPPARSDDALLNDAELARMETSGLSVWGRTELLSDADRLQLYTLLTKATDRIVFSYACAGSAGELAPSPLLDTVRALFSLPEPETVVKPDASLPATPEVGFLRMAGYLRDYRADGFVHRQLPALHDYFAHDEAYASATDSMLAGDAGTQAKVRLGKALARALYGEAPKMSASQLEQFAGCPFREYLSYGLRLQERKESTERADNVGTFLHDALDMFVKTAAEEGKDLRAMTDEEAYALLDRILEPLIASHNDGIFERDLRSREALTVRTRMLRWCVSSVLRQLRESSFTVAATETSFGWNEDQPQVKLTLSDGTQITLRGKIDRIDRSLDGTMFRIVDYKTGKGHTFDPTKFRSGETIQLPLYLEAAKQFGGEAVGIYYMPLTADKPKKDGDIPKNKLSGVTASDPEAIAASDGNLSGYSKLIFKLKTGKNGCEGDIVTRAQLEALKEQALRTATNAAERIMNGEADIRYGKDRCKYCPFGAVCRYDRQLGFRERTAKTCTLSDLLNEGGDTNG
jgi:ATP-dependent helicase/nuclease subunit B